jgi:hypothetical protein
VLGADVARQLIRADLLDDRSTWFILGEGTPMFDGEPGRGDPRRKPVVGSVTHLRFRVAKGANGAEKGCE